MREVERIWQEIDERAAAEFLRKFLQLKSANPPGEEVEAARLVCNWMSRLGVEAEVILLQGKRVNPPGPAQIQIPEASPPRKVNLEHRDDLRRDKDQCSP